MKAPRKRRGLAETVMGSLKDMVAEVSAFSEECVTIATLHKLGDLTIDKVSKAHYRVLLRTIIQQDQKESIARALNNI